LQEARGKEGAESKPLVDPADITSVIFGDVSGAMVGTIRGMRRGQEGEKAMINGAVLSVEGTGQGKSEGVIKYRRDQQS
jgi:uncharacterized membrane protein